jgi:hypothetical protein
VFGQHGGIGDGIDGEQCVIGHHHVGEAGFLSCLLREAVRAERTARYPDALPRRDTDLTPRPIGHTGFDFVAVTGLGRLRPGGQAFDIATERAGGHRLEQLLLRPVVRLGCTSAAVDLVEAQVVSATLQKCELRAAG